MKTFEFNGETLTLDMSKFYRDGTPAIQIFCEDGEPFATLTVSVDHRLLLKPGQFIVKTWSENEPIAKALLAAGAFKDTGERIPTGFVEAQVWELLD